jgi:hypothetical protein
MLVELREALESLLNMRVQEGKWNDSENEPGLLRNLEAISCFGSPAYYFERLKIFDRKFELIKIPEDILTTDLRSILKTVDELGYPPQPYLDADVNGKYGIPYAKGKTDFVDTASFFSSGLLDLMEYYEVVYNKEIPNYKEVSRYLKDSINWLVENALVSEKGVSWSWGNKNLSEAIPSVYFTWSAVVALSYAISSIYCPLADAEKERIKTLLSGVAKWIVEIIKEDPDYPKTRWRINYPRFSDTFSGKHEAFLVYIISIIDWLNQIEIDVPKDTSLKVISTILDIYRKNQMWRFEGLNHLILLPPEITGSKKSIVIEYEDRSCEYLLMGALSWFYMMHNEKKILLDDNDFNDLETMIEELRKKMISERDPIKKVWKKDGFLLYLTQRAIESITTYFRYVYPHKGMEISLYDSVRLAVESAFDDIKPQLIERIYKNIELLKKGLKEE